MSFSLRSCGIAGIVRRCVIEGVGVIPAAQIIERTVVDEVSFTFATKANDSRFRLYSIGDYLGCMGSGALEKTWMQ